MTTTRHPNPLKRFNDPLSGPPAPAGQPPQQQQLGPPPAPPVAQWQPYGADPAQTARIAADAALHTLTQLQSLPQPQPLPPRQPAPQPAPAPATSPDIMVELQRMREESAARETAWQEAMRAMATEAAARTTAWMVRAEVNSIVAQYNGDIDIDQLDQTSVEACRASVPKALESFRRTEQFFMQRLQQQQLAQQQGQRQAVVESLPPYPPGYGYPTAPQAPAPVQNAAPQAPQFVHPQLGHEAARSYAQFREDLRQGRVVENIPPGYPAQGQPYGMTPVSHPQQQGQYVMPMQQPATPQFYPNPADPYQGQPGFYPNQQPQQPGFYPNQGPPYQEQPGFYPNQGPPQQPQAAPLPNVNQVPMTPQQVAAVRQEAVRIAAANRVNPGRVAGMLQGKPAQTPAVGGGTPAPTYTGYAPLTGDASSHPMFRN